MDVNYLKLNGKHYKTVEDNAMYCKKCVFCQGAGCALQGKEEGKICWHSNIYWIEDKFSTKNVEH